MRTVEMIPPSGSQDIEVFRPSHFHLKFSSTVASPDDMGVGIYKSRQDYAISGIESGLEREGGA